MKRELKNWALAVWSVFWIGALAGIVAPAHAQNPTCPTRPPGTTGNACASVDFVGAAVAVVSPPALPLSLANGGLGGSQAGATANQIPVFPGSGGAAVPTSASTWFDNAYCNTVGFLIVRFTGAWTCVKSVSANPVWWGADPTGAADSATAFNSALAANANVEFPAGKFKMNSGITYNIASGINSVTVKGAGQDLTILTWPSGSGGMTFNYGGGLSNSVHIRDLSITTGTTTGGNAILLNNTISNANPAFTAASDIYRVTIRGDDGYAVTDYWTNGVNVGNVSNVNFNGVSVYGASTPNGTGLSFVGLPGSSTFAVQLNVVQSALQSLATGILYGSFIQGAAVDSSNFTGTTNGIVAATSETGTLAQLSVTNSQFNGGTTANANGILTQTAINGALIANNLFLVPGTGGTGISMPLSKLTIIEGNTFWGQNSNASEQGVSITNTNSLPCTIQGNIFFGFNGTTSTGLNLGATSANCTVGGNSFLTNTNNVVDTGTNNQYWNNSGFDPAWATYAAAPACGNNAITLNASKRKTSGKQTWIELDLSLNATIGTCTNTLTFTLPVAANSRMNIPGQEFNNSHTIVGCVTAAASSTATCNLQAAANFGASNNFVISGVYENQ
jgi:nitrous oxidase accessory protein NosD